MEVNDDPTPVPADANGKTDSFIASVFPVVTAKQVMTAMDQDGVTEVNLTYKDCSVDLYYNVETAEIYSLKQNVNYSISAKDGILPLKGSVSEINTYSNFIY